MRVRAEDFLAGYRVLEETLGARYINKPRSHASVVMEYLQEPESAMFRDKLDTIREMRNLLSHNADRYGAPVFEPSQGVLDTLNEIIDFVRRPPLAMQFATGVDRLLCARMDDRALPLVRIMEKRGFSHVPVIEGGLVSGVFSVRTLFSRMARDPNFDIRPEATLRTFEMLLPIEAHRGERYAFLPADATLDKARSAFESYPVPNKRLAAIFLTRSGGADTPLEAMITPWDVLGQKEKNP